MPIPVIAGIPWLAGLLGGIVSSLFSFFAVYMGRKFAMTLAMISLIVAATTAFVTLLTSLLSGITYVSPELLGVAVGLFLPSNFSVCMSVMVSAKIAVWAYSWNVRLIQYKFGF